MCDFFAECQIFKMLHFSELFINFIGLVGPLTPSKTLSEQRPRIKGRKVEQFFKTFFIFLIDAIV